MEVKLLIINVPLYDWMTYNQILNCGRGRIAFSIINEKCDHNYRYDVILKTTKMTTSRPQLRFCRFYEGLVCFWFVVFIQWVLSLWSFGGVLYFYIFFGSSSWFGVALLWSIYGFAFILYCLLVEYLLVLIFIIFSAYISSWFYNRQLIQYTDSDPFSPNFPTFTHLH